VKKPVFASVYDANYKLLEKLEPDIILTTSGIHLKLAREFHSRGYNVFPVQLPKNVFEIISTILVIGTLVNKQWKACKLATELILELETLRTTIKSYKRPKFMQRYGRRNSP